MRNALTAIVIAACALGAKVAVADSGASAADVARASELYKSAEAAMKEARFADALRDYGAAYDITKDPVLFFKIGNANEKAGKCDVAIVYFRRYLAEAKPAANFSALTKERLLACGAPADSTTDPTTTPPIPPPPPPPIDPNHKQPPLTTMPLYPTAKPAGHSNAPAWIVIGGSLALLTTGAVLAFSASSSESDVQDLYVGNAGVVPTFDAATAKRYQELLDEGHRYEHLSWAAFGAAAVAGGVAAYLFVRGGGHERAPFIAPTVAPQSAGVTALFSF